MKTINQYKVVQNQYKTADNLNTRISIHKKYSTNKLGFNNWIFSHYNISPNIRILELGNQNIICKGIVNSFTVIRLQRFRQYDR